MKYYIGLLPKGPELFQSETEPTEQTHGKAFKSVIGPFVTKRGAEFMRDHGFGNPHCETVADAERLAKHYEKQQGKENCISCGRYLGDDESELVFDLCVGYDDCPSYYEEAGKPTPKFCE